MAWRAIRKTGWFYCDRCKAEVEDPVYELHHEEGSTGTWHYLCRQHALKRVTSADLSALQDKEEKSRDKRRAGATQNAATAHADERQGLRSPCAEKGP